MGKKKSEKNKHEEKNPLEWVVFGISLLLVTGLLIYLTIQAVTYESTPPDLSVTFIPDPSPNAPFQHVIKIKNDGHQTASEVLVEISIQNSGNKVETATLKIPFVPQQSEAEGWVSFSVDPELADSMTGRVVSYNKP